MRRFLAPRCCCAAPLLFQFWPPKGLHSRRPNPLRNASQGIATSMSEIDGKARCPAYGGAKMTPGMRLASSL